MERKNIFWLILVSVIITVLISFIIPILFSGPHNGPEQSPEQLRHAPMDQQPPLEPVHHEIIHLKTLISFINIGLIIPLLFIYVGIYRKIHSSFTLGLLSVIFALGMYAITSNPLLIGLLGGWVGDIGLFQIIPDLCAMIALIIFIRISLE